MEAAIADAHLQKRALLRVTSTVKIVQVRKFSLPDGNREFMKMKFDI